MEQITAINPARIGWCCRDYDITPEDLASELGIAKSSMDRVMSGEGGFSFTQLSKIAAFFGRGVLFFLEPGKVDGKKVHTAEFRTLANQKPELSHKLRKLIERVERQRDVYLNLLEEIDELEQQKFYAPKLPRNNPKQAATIAREWLELESKNNFDSYRKAIQDKGVLVFRSNGYNGPWQIPKDIPILGFTLYDVVCPVIVIKKQPWETRQSFTLMHELGHLLIHRSSSIDDDDDMYSHQGHEQDANAFAGHLLVPDDFLLEISDKKRPEDVSQYDKWLENQRKQWGISGEVILRRLLDVGRLSSAQYKTYRQWRESITFPEKSGGSREYRHREPAHVFGDQFVCTVLDALNSQRITLAKASTYLDNLKIKDVHKLGDRYARF